MRKKICFLLQPEILSISSSVCARVCACTCGAALLFSLLVISPLRPQQTVTLHLMLWKWRGSGARPRCFTEAETCVHRDAAHGQIRPVPLHEDTPPPSPPEDTLKLFWAHQSQNRSCSISSELLVRLKVLLVVEK